MPNKLTDSEIIKAFELCLKCEDFTGCRECPAINNGHNTIPKCRLALFNSVLDLINRLQAKNERLKSLEENFDKLLYMLNAVNMGQSVLEEQKHIIKAEAYKECIEKVKKLWGNYTGYEFEKKLNNLLNELVGEDDVD